MFGGGLSPGWRQKSELGEQSALVAFMLNKFLEYSAPINRSKSALTTAEDVRQNVLVFWALAVLRDP